MTDPFSWMLQPPAVPAWEGPARVHFILDDDIPSRMPPTMVAGEALQRAAAAVARPRRKDKVAYQRHYRKLRLEEDAAARGETFLPLEPGQQRRRRVGPDGKPIKRTRRSTRRSAAAPMDAPKYVGPKRAPGEMTYGQAARLIHRANDGDLVDLEELAKAHDVVRQTREAVATS